MSLASSEIDNKYNWLICDNLIYSLYSFEPVKRLIFLDLSIGKVTI